MMCWGLNSQNIVPVLGDCQQPNSRGFVVPIMYKDSLYSLSWGGMTIPNYEDLIDPIEQVKPSQTMHDFSRKVPKVTSSK